MAPISPLDRTGLSSLLTVQVPEHIKTEADLTNWVASHSEDLIGALLGYSADPAQRIIIASFIIKNCSKRPSCANLVKAATAVIDQVSLAELFVEAVGLGRILAELNLATREALRFWIAFIVCRDYSGKGGGQYDVLVTRCTGIMEAARAVLIKTTEPTS